MKHSARDLASGGVARLDDAALTIELEIALAVAALLAFDHRERETAAFVVDVGQRRIKIMQIGFDAKRLFFNQTGLGNYSRNLVKNLHQYYPNPTYHLYAPRPIPSHSFFNHQRFILHQNTSISAAIWRSWGQTKQWTKQGLQIYHGLSNELPFRKPASVKTVVTIHDLIFKTLPATYPFLDRWVYDEKVKSSCQQADQIVAISQQTKEDICTYYAIDPEKIKVIYQSVDSTYYQLATRNDIPLRDVVQKLPKQYFLCVGTLTQRKNQLQILKAWQQLDRSYQLPIVLVGQGKKYAKTLKSYAQEKQIPVYFLENIHRLEDLQAIYRQATVFIYPSLYEGFGLPLVEAQLSNVPVITTRASAMQEAVSPSALLIDPTKTEELTAAISILLSDEKVFLQLQEAGNAYAHATFHPKRVTAQMWSLYQSLL